MEAYPSDYVVHNLPLILLSGLEPNKVETPIGETTQEFLGDGGFRLRADLAPLYHPLTKDLRATLLSYDRSDAPWRSLSTGKTEQAQAFKIRSVGRVGQAPPLPLRVELLLISHRHILFRPVKHRHLLIRPA